ncbi:MAG: hypothetical protein ABI183_23000 [Polyangiaceae bacterium]
MLVGVTFTQVPGGHVPAATHGSGGSGPLVVPPPSAFADAPFEELFELLH